MESATRLISAESTGNRRSLPQGAQTVAAQHRSPRPVAALLQALGEQEKEVLVTSTKYGHSVLAAEVRAYSPSRGVSGPVRYRPSNPQDQRKRGPGRESRAAPPPTFPGLRVGSPRPAPRRGASGNWRERFTGSGMALRPDGARVADERGPVRSRGQSAPRPRARNKDRSPARGHGPRWLVAEIAWLRLQIAAMPLGSGSEPLPRPTSSTRARCARVFRYRSPEPGCIRVAPCRQARDHWRRSGPPASPGGAPPVRPSPVRRPRCRSRGRSTRS